MTKKIPLSKVYSDMTLAELYEHQGMLMGLWELSMDNQNAFEKCLDQLAAEIKIKLESYFSGIDFNA